MRIHSEYVPECRAESSPRELTARERWHNQSSVAVFPHTWAIIATRDLVITFPTRLPCFDSSSRPAVVFIKMDFPTDVTEFDSDPRISFSRLDNSFLLETSDGREFLFNSILKRWVETVCNKRIRTLTLCDGLSTMQADNPQC